MAVKQIALVVACLACALLASDEADTNQLGASTAILDVSIAKASAEVFLMSAGAASVIDSCTTAASGSDSCTMSPGPVSEEDEMSLLQGKAKAVHQGANDKTSAAFSHDSIHNIEKMRAVGMIAVQPQADKAAARKSKNVFGVMKSPLPKNTEQLAAVEATWDSDSFLEANGHKRLTESSIWLDEAPIPIGHAKKQEEFCKVHPAAAWDKERMAASLEIVRNFTQALRKAGIPPMIMTGTLLALYRQGFLINGDSDLDFWIPRQFMSNASQWNPFVEAMALENIRCFSNFQQYAAGWKIACSQIEGNGWKLKDGDEKGFYVDISVIDEECQVPPCTWTEYLTIGKDETAYPGSAGPFNWRLFSWHDVTLWAPSEPEVPLNQLYPGWQNPGGSNYNHWMQNTPIPNDGKLQYLVGKNQMDLSAANIMKLQEQLERDNAKKIEEDASKQNEAVEFCATKKEEEDGRKLLQEEQEEDAVKPS